MTPREKRHYMNRVVAESRKFLGCDYVMGRRFRGDPPVGDCRGLAEQAYINAGIREAMGGTHMNVRAEVRWAEANDRARDPAKHRRGTRGWWAIYNEPAKVGLDPKNPMAIRHVAPIQRGFSKAYPEGWALSAMNPKLGVVEHTLFPLRVTKPNGKVVTYKHLALYMLVEPYWDLIGASDVPIEDPEPPIEEPV